MSNYSLEGDGRLVIHFVNYGLFEYHYVPFIGGLFTITIK